MKWKAMVAQLANRINQPHVINLYMRKAFEAGKRYRDAHPAWRMCEDEMPTDPHQPYWVYAKCCGECCVAYLQEKTNIFYDEGGEELSGVVAWLPLPEFNPKTQKG